MNNRLQKISFYISFVEALAMWTLSPTILIYFIDRISSNVIGASNIIGALGAFIVVYNLKNEKVLEKLFTHFKLITIIDFTAYVIVNFGFINYPALRTLGFAVVIAVTYKLVVSIWQAKINKVLAGNALSIYTSQLEQYTMAGKLIGSLLATFLIFNLNIEVAIILSILAQFIVLIGFNFIYAQIDCNK